MLRIINLDELDLPAENLKSLIKHRFDRDLAGVTIAEPVQIDGKRMYSFYRSQDGFPVAYHLPGRLTKELAKARSERANSGLYFFVAEEISWPAVERYLGMTGNRFPGSPRR